MGRIRILVSEYFMTERTTRSAMKALLKAAAAVLVSLSFLAPVSVAPLHAGEAIDALNIIAAPSDPPAVPVIEPPAEPAVNYVSAARPLKVYFLNVGQGDS